MARELGTTVPVIRRLLAQAGIGRPLQPVMTAMHRRRATDQRLAVRAAGLGFATLERYLADRVVQRGWPLQRIADELELTCGPSAIGCGGPISTSGKRAIR